MARIYSRIIVIAVAASGYGRAVPFALFKLTLDVLVLIVILFIIGECRVTVVVETITQLGRIGVDGGIVIIAVCSPLRGDIALGLKASGNVGFLAEPVLVCIFRRVRSLAIGGRSRRHAPQVVHSVEGHDAMRHRSSHQPLARTVRSASIGLTLAGCHQVPGNFIRGWMTERWPLSISPEPTG